MSTLGFGAKVGYSTASPLSLTKIRNLRDIQIPKWVFDKLEETTHGTQKLKQHRPGLADVTDTVIKVLSDFSLAEQRELRDYSLTQTVLWIRIEFPLTDSFVTDNKWIALEFPARVADFGPAVPQAANQETDITLMFGGTDPGGTGSSFTWYDGGGAGVATSMS